MRPPGDARVRIYVAYPLRDGPADRLEVVPEVPEPRPNLREAAYCLTATRPSRCFWPAHRLVTKPIEFSRVYSTLPPRL
jgi:hypothetical protein